MDYDAKTISDIVNKVLSKYGSSTTTNAEVSPSDYDVPLGVSNRHIHLNKEDLETLFGPGYQLNPLKELSQPGQYACKETLTIIGPSLKSIENVRVLGPLRKESQVEISRTDSFTLKVRPPVRESGSLNGSAPITIVGPKGIVTLKQGCILANRHIHMAPADAARYNVVDGEYVDVETKGDGKRTLLYDVQVRVNDKFVLEMHLDTDDANACGIGNNSKVKLVKRK